MAMFVDKCVYASLYDMWFASFMLYASLMPCFMMQNTMLNIYAYVTCYANYMWEYMQVICNMICKLCMWFYTC